MAIRILLTLLTLALLFPLAVQEAAGQTHGTHGKAHARPGSGAKHKASKPKPEAGTSLRAQLDAALAENQRLGGELAAMKSATPGNGGVSPAEAERMKTELISIKQASANVVQIQEERDRLQERVIKMERELEAASRENYALDRENRQDWFMIGAGVLLGGILLGVFLPRFSWRKKSNWDSF